MPAFIRVEGSQFFAGEEAYRFLGTNFWYGLNLALEGPAGDRPRLGRELDRLQALGLTNLRIMGASEGPADAPWQVVPTLQPEPGVFAPEQLDALDYLLAEMTRRDLRAVVCLNNFWPWSGGMARYVAWATDTAIPYPPPAAGGDWARYQLFTSRFYKLPAAQARFEQLLATLLLRTNAYTGLAYRDDPTIMAWQLANEPRGIIYPKAYRRWILRTATFIKTLAPKQLVSLGSEGWTPSRFAGNHFRQDHAFPEIDYTTCHIWVQNWGWYDPAGGAGSLDAGWQKAEAYLRKHARQARAMNKPLVLEEFGLSRDGDDHDPAAPVSLRNRYFARMIETCHEIGLSGVNFWAWGGEGRPQQPKTLWQPGHDLIGDPPHEYQGWYSVYDQDQSTLDLLARLAQKWSRNK